MACKYRYVKYIKFNLKLTFTKLPVTSALLMLNCVDIGCFTFEIACNNCDIQ